MFSNLRGCDGERVYFSGCSSIALNGHIVAKGNSFGLKDVVSKFSYTVVINMLEVLNSELLLLSQLNRIF